MTNSTNNTEQVVCGIIGGGLLLHTIRRMSIIDWIGTGLGCAMIYMASGGKLGSMLQPAGSSEEEGRGFPQYSGGYESGVTDAVEEASMESFPASDPPASTSASA